VKGHVATTPKEERIDILPEGERENKEGIPQWKAWSLRDEGVGGVVGSKKALDWQGAHFINKKR